MLEDELKKTVKYSKDMCKSLTTCLDVFTQEEEVSHGCHGDDIENITTDMSLLTLSPLSKTVVPYANSFDLDETPSNSASHPDHSCLSLKQHFHQL